MYYITIYNTLIIFIDNELRGYIIVFMYKVMLSYR